MASAVLLVDEKGKAIISRDYRGEIAVSQVPEKFVEHVILADDANLKPVFTDDGITYCWVKKNNVYMVAATRLNANAMMLLAFLEMLADIYTSYYHKLEENTIRDNFVLTYELLDEVMDNGFPQTTDVKVLRRYITNSAHRFAMESVRAPSCITDSVSWRAEGIKHKKNEIFLDVIESVHVLIGSNGGVLKSEIMGNLKMKSFLSGMPELKLGLNDKLLLVDQTNPDTAPRGTGSGFVELEDVKFHQCVRLNRFETDRTISFIPPDGEFELMSYRLTQCAGGELTPPFKFEIQVNPGGTSSSTQTDFIIKIRSTYKPRSVASFVEVHLPCPKDAACPILKSSSGSMKHHPDSSTFVWTLKHFPGMRENIATARFTRSTVGREEENFCRRPIEVKFEIPYFTLSGTTVRYLKIFEQSGYQALPWVRYITQNGDYHVRTVTQAPSPVPGSFIGP